MVMTASTMMPLGTVAPDFNLPDTQGNRVALTDLAEWPALVVVFMCNHCPFVQHIQHALTKIAADYQQKGVAFVGINSNDVTQYPEDSLENMAREAKRLCYPFPYLYDEKQDVAKAYGAACTPDFFLFDVQRRLVYRGQMDDSRPGKNIPVSGRDLRNAMDALLAGLPVPDVQKPSIGCNIKWKVQRQ